MFIIVWACHGQTPYTVSEKKQDTCFVITLANIVNRFTKFTRHKIPEEAFYMCANKGFHFTRTALLDCFVKFKTQKCHLFCCSPQ